MAEETKDTQTTRDASGDILFLVQSAHVRGQSSSTEDKDLLREVTRRDWQFSNINSVQHQPAITALKTPRIEEDFKLELGEESFLENGTAMQMVTVSYKKRRTLDISHPAVQFSKELGKYDDFNSKLLSSESGLTFQDHACRFNIYEKSSNEAEESSGILNLYMTVEKNYNFLLEEYESMMVDDTELSEVDLPNFYSVMFANEEDKEDEYNFKKRPKSFLSNLCRRVATLEGRITLPQVSFNLTEHISRSILAVSNVNPIVNYLSSYSSTVVREPRNEILFESEKQKRTFFSKEETKKMSELSRFREMFPMYTRIRFRTEFESGFGDTLSETNYTSKIRDFIDTQTPNPVNTHEVISRISENAYPTLNQFDPTSYEVPTSQTRRFYDVDEFFEKHFDNDPVDSFYFTGLDMNGGNQYKAYYSLMTIIARAKIEKIKKEKFRTFNDVINGKTSHTETVMYAIRKYDQTNSLIQVFYFTNSKDLKEVDFIDTQVKYDKKYRYELSVVKLVVGTEYTYYTALDDRPLSTTYRVVSKPSLKLVEVSLVSDFSLIIDSMPLPPEFYPIPIVDVNNRVRWFLNSSIGKMMAKPITFTSEEQERVEEQKIAQKIPPDQEEIMYETDDGITRFEVHRLNYPPRTYEDFYMNGERVEVRTSFDDELVATSSSYEDKILPNEKYYYCARSIDSHSNVSNPTMVWEVELVSEAGACYPKFREYEMETGKEKNYKKSAKRFIQISPAYMQSVVNNAASGIGPEGPSDNLRDIALGVAEQTIWGKKFKLRLTSKATGKKVDFNFVFKVKPRDEIF